MKIISYSSYPALGNTYIIVPEDTKEILLVDPSCIDIKFFRIIEDNDYYVKSILLTDNDVKYFHLVKTIQKIYDCQVFAHKNLAEDMEITPVGNGTRIISSDIQIDVFSPEESSRGKKSFLCNEYIFTGKLLSAGRLDWSRAPLEKKYEMRFVQNKILKLPKETILLPAFGPPSTIFTELKWNPYVPF